MFGRQVPNPKELIRAANYKILDIFGQEMTETDGNCAFQFVSSARHCLGHSQEKYRFIHGVGFAGQGPVKTKW